MATGFAALTCNRVKRGWLRWKNGGGAKEDDRAVERTEKRRRRLGSLRRCLIPPGMLWARERLEGFWEATKNFSAEKVSGWQREGSELRTARTIGARRTIEGLVGRWQAFLYRRGCGTVCSYGSKGPTMDSL